jgi:hypothetical protein
VSGLQQFLPGLQQFLPGLQHVVLGSEHIIPGLQQLVPGLQLSVPGLPQVVPGSEQLVRGLQRFVPGLQTFVPGLLRNVRCTFNPLPGVFSRGHRAQHLCVLQVDISCYELHFSSYDISKKAYKDHQYSFIISNASGFSNHKKTIRTLHLFKTQNPKP